MNNAPFFSVVIPVYNKEPHVSRAINSVLSQSYKSYELVIVCDPSTDNSIGEVEKFSDPRIRVLYRRERGPGGYAARNLGIKEAKADWVALLDADDEWTANHLNHMSELIVKHPDCQIVSCGWVSCTPSSENIQPYYRREWSRGIHLIALPDYLQSALRGERFCHSSVVALKRCAVLEVGGFPEGLANKGGDLYLWVKMLEDGTGAWSPHLGAKVYRDAVNMVTHSSYFQPSLFAKLIDDTPDHYDRFTKKRLIDYVNLLLIKDYVASCSRDAYPAFRLMGNVKMGSFKVWLKALSVSLTPPRVISMVCLIRRAINQHR